MLLFLLIIIISIIGIIALSGNGYDDKISENEETDEKSRLKEEFRSEIKAFIIIGLIIASLFLVGYMVWSFIADAMFVLFDPFVDALHETQKHG
ncbi:hypothetical protein [Ruminococcus sp.]|jgi:hypothetical protein|uniref:hypothetical protein n=1 Tax=Ruminococcus sp. TaxID=41978 RepID=UPI0025E0A4A6|nr:hypothetical protein [Ruminococcus sp.]